MTVKAAETIVSAVTPVEKGVKDQDMSSNGSHNKANYSYDVYILGSQPHEIYTGVLYPIYVKTENPNGDSFTLKSDKTITKAVNREFADITYIDSRTQKVRGGYLQICSFEKAGATELSIIEYQDREGSLVSAYDYIQGNGHCVPVKSFTTHVIDTETEFDKWIEELINTHTRSSMSSMEKMESICEYLTSPQAGFKYPANMNGKLVRLGSDIFGPAFVTHTWDSYISPQVLCRIAEKIGGFSDIHNCYRDYPAGSADWQRVHGYCRVTADQTTKYFSVCPWMSTGQISSYSTFDFGNQSYMWKVG